MMFKRAIAALALAAGLMILTPPAQASAESGWWSRWNQWRKQRTAFVMQRRGQRVGQQVAAKQTAETARPVPASSASVPELDPNAAGSALVLLIGGVAYIASRRREEQDPA